MAKKKRTNPRRRMMSAADVKRATKMGTLNALRLTVFVALKVLHDRFAFGPVRLARFFEEYKRTANDWDAGLFTVADLAEWVEEYAGIAIDDDIEKI